MVLDYKSLMASCCFKCWIEWCLMRYLLRTRKLEREVFEEEEREKGVSFQPNISLEQVKPVKVNLALFLARVSYALFYNQRCFATDCAHYSLHLFELSAMAKQTSLLWSLSSSVSGFELFVCDSQYFSSTESPGEHVFPALRIFFCLVSRYI